MKGPRKLGDYRLYVASTCQASDYENTSEFTIDHIKKTFDQGNDIAKEMHTMIAVDPTTWEPTLQMRTDTDLNNKIHISFRKRPSKDTTIFEKCCKKANELLFAFLYLENLDQVKFSSILEKLYTAKVTR